jgi:hypothetical protein
LGFRHPKQVDDLLLNIEESLLHSRHVRLGLLAHYLGFVASNTKLIFDGLKFETVESLDVVLSKVLEFSFSSNTDSRVILFCDHLLVEIA